MILAASGGSDPSSISQWGAATGAFALLTISVGIIFKLLYNYSQESKVCNWRLGILVETLRTHGILPPMEFYWGPPDVSEKRKRKMGISFTRDEQGLSTPEWLGYVVAVGVFVIGVCLIQYYFVIRPIQELQEGQTHNELNDAQTICNNSLTADYFVALNLAIQATPGSEERNNLVDLANKAAERIRNRDAICEDGKPDNFPFPPPKGAAVPPTT